MIHHVSAICYPHSISKISVQFFLQLAFNDEGKNIGCMKYLAYCIYFQQKQSHFIKTRSWFETALDYEPQILRIKRDSSK